MRAESGITNQTSLFLWKSSYNMNLGSVAARQQVENRTAGGGQLLE